MTENADQCELKWKEGNPGWYPDAVRNHRSEALNDFIESVIRDTKNSLQSFHQQQYNNLTPGKRLALKKLMEDSNIVIKP